MALGFFKPQSIFDIQSLLGYAGKDLYDYIKEILNNYQLKLVES